MKVDKKFFDTLIAEWGPKAQKFGDDALKLVKKGASVGKLNVEIKKQEALILNYERNIGKEVFDKKISINNEKIKSEISKIKKAKELIDKNKRALKAIDEVQKSKKAVKKNNKKKK